MSKIKLWMQKKKHFLFAAAAIAVLTAGMSLAFFTDAETAANTNEDRKRTDRDRRGSRWSQKNGYLGDRNRKIPLLCANAGGRTCFKVPGRRRSENLVSQGKL